MITIKNNAEQEGIRRSADLLSQVFSQISSMMEPGISTSNIDQIVHETVKKGGGSPAFLGYGGFPASLCTSVNEQVIHGIPNRRPLKKGDIVGCDIGVVLDGYYSDACKTYPIGVVSESISQLLEQTQASLSAAIEVCYPGNRIKEIGKAVCRVVKPQGYGVVDSYCGHGVGLSLHEDPQIPNYYPSSGTNLRLKQGMVLAIEPMINLGTAAVDVLEDGWTVVTKDGQWSAHFEHTVLITAKGPEILTNWEG